MRFLSFVSDDITHGDHALTKSLFAGSKFAGISALSNALTLQQKEGKGCCMNAGEKDRKK